MTAALNYIPDDLFDWVNMIQPAADSQYYAADMSFQTMAAMDTSYARFSNNTESNYVMSSPAHLPSLTRKSVQNSPHFHPSPLGNNAQSYHTTPSFPSMSRPLQSMHAHSYDSTLQNDVNSIHPKKKPGRKTKSVTLSQPILSIDEKKVERQVKNREAADISRQRKRERMSGLEIVAWNKCLENTKLKDAIHRLTIAKSNAMNI